ncbi:hypothetical protein [Rathayibacter caricis]|uniref:hypothetical protein n=1 Tax=Rathayibacter caricis TaxID=110936 RepID=UPI001FB4446D|nr:hypothetical protein [Rathayibacter caricis]
MSRTTTPHAGQHAWFIRYVSTREGWVAETIRGDVTERTTTGWVLRVGTELRELSESEWSVYCP